MGFDSVFRCLQELFPQVDARILKAVAVENAKDTHAAVESIVTDVLPYLAKQSEAHSSFSESHDHKSSDAHVRHLPAQAVGTTDTSSSKIGATATDEDANESDEINESHHADPMILIETVHGSLDSTFYDAEDKNDPLGEHSGVKQMSLSETCDGLHSELGHIEPSSATFDSSTNRELIDVNKNQESGLNEGDETVVLQKYQELDGDLNVNKTSHPSTSSSNASDYIPDDNLINDLNMVSCDIDSLSSDSNTDIAVCQKEQPSHSSNSLGPDNILELESSFESKHGDPYNLCQLPSFPVKEQASKASESLQLEVEHLKSTSDVQILEFHWLVDAISEQDAQLSANTNIDNSPLVNSVVTRSGQVCSIDLLEDIIEDAKSHKKRLFSAMESVMKLTREVELKEKEAEQAKEEADRGGLEILANVEKLKVMLKRASEAKEMHSGEVYGERAILATEVRELQNRLLSLSEERDKYLSILEEMQKILEARKAVAEKEIIAAEQEKLEKESSARDDLAEQGRIMEKVVEESNILKREAEENEKLREFLVDRGRIVDALQGEISVICQDVKLVKDKFDDCIPLSQSLSLTQTSSILASLASSQKSTLGIVSDQSVSEQTQSADDESISQERSLERRVVICGAYKELSDDDWELFEATA